MNKFDKSTLSQEQRDIMVEAGGFIFKGSVPIYGPADVDDNIKKLKDLITYHKGLVALYHNTAYWGRARISLSAELEQVNQTIELMYWELVFLLDWKFDYSFPIM